MLKLVIQVCRRRRSNSFAAVQFQNMLLEEL